MMRRLSVAALGVAAVAVSVGRSSGAGRYSSASSYVRTGAVPAEEVPTSCALSSSASSCLSAYESSSVGYSDDTAGTTTVRLASSVARPWRPTTVFVHGLDSAKDTWISVEANMKLADYPVLALDLRGHGESPLGNPDDFSTATLAADVRRVRGAQAATIACRMRGWSRTVAHSSHPLAVKQTRC
jgi:hypothetical protein